MGIGERIKQARQKAGLSQKDLAEAIEVKRNTLAAWEIDRNEPDAENIRKIAVACHVSADWLLNMPADYSVMPDEPRRLAEQIAALDPQDRQAIERILAAMQASKGKAEKVAP